MIGSEQMSSKGEATGMELKAEEITRLEPDTARAYGGYSQLANLPPTPTASATAPEQTERPGLPHRPYRAANSPYNHSIPEQPAPTRTSPLYT